MMDMDELTRRGATIRLLEIETERQELLKFVNAEVESATAKLRSLPGGKRPVSLTARQKMSEAAKKRWADREAAEG